MRYYRLPSFNASDLSQTPSSPVSHRSGAKSATELSGTASSPIANQTQAQHERVGRGKPRLYRETFETSRFLDFFSAKQLTVETGHPPAEWPLVILKEALDNSLDGCEEAGVAPEIIVRVRVGRGDGSDAIMISDNGPGIPADVVDSILDYSIRVSSREAYVSPTRGAQGNALKTIVAMPFALDGNSGITIIAGKGVGHAIVFRVDRLKQQPVIDHQRWDDSTAKGTRIEVSWPDSASSILTSAKSSFLQIADDYAWVNPHLRISVVWNAVTEIDRQPSDPTWRKWLPSHPTSAHWYDLVRLERYLAAHAARDRDLGRIRLVREFISEFAGFAGSAKQKLVLDETGLARSSISSLFESDGTPRRAEIKQLLAALRRHSTPIQPRALGAIGKPHLRDRFEAAGAHPNSFKYKRVAGIDGDGLPCILETAFGYRTGSDGFRRIIAGANWSVGLGNPFRSFGRRGEGLESLLAEQRARSTEPIIFLVHFACPRVEYTDRGKSAIVVRGGADV